MRLVRLPSLLCEVRTGATPCSVLGAQGCDGGLFPRSCPLRHGRRVSGAPRSSARGARLRMTRLVRLVRSGTLALAQAALGPGYPLCPAACGTEPCRPSRSSMQRGIVCKMDAADVLYIITRPSRHNSAATTRTLTWCDVYLCVVMNLFSYCMWPQVLSFWRCKPTFEASASQ